MGPLVVEVEVMDRRELMLNQITIMEGITLVGKVEMCKTL